VFVALVTQHAKRLRHIASHLWPVRQYRIFPHYLIHGTIFEKKKVTECKTCVLIFSTVFETFLILSSSKRNIIINVRRFSCKVPVILVRFQWNMNFLGSFPNILKHRLSRKSAHWKPPSTKRTDGHDEAKSGFSQFCERPYQVCPSLGGPSLSTERDVTSWTPELPQTTNTNTTMHTAVKHAFWEMRSLAFPIVGYRSCTKLPIGSKKQKGWGSLVYTNSSVGPTVTNTN
jgi:hypothetical protein